MPHDGNESSNTNGGEVPLFVRGQQNGGYHNNSYDDDDDDDETSNNQQNNNDRLQNDGTQSSLSSNKLQDLQRRLLETNSRADEATQLNINLEQELQAHAVKRMNLEKELNDVHRQHMTEMATQKAEYEILHHDYEKLQHVNLKLREELLRTNRELMGVLAKKNEFKRDAERAARSAISDENRAKAELTNQQHPNPPNPNPNPNSLSSSSLSRNSNSGHDLLSGHRHGNVNDYKSLRTNTPTPPKLLRIGNDDPRAIRAGNALNDLSDFFDM